MAIAEDTKKLKIPRRDGPSKIIEAHENEIVIPYQVAEIGGMDKIIDVFNKFNEKTGRDESVSSYMVGRPGGKTNAYGLESYALGPEGGAGGSLGTGDGGLGYGSAPSQNNQLAHRSNPPEDHYLGHFKDFFRAEPSPGGSYENLLETMGKLPEKYFNSYITIPGLMNKVAEGLGGLLPEGTAPYKDITPGGMALDARPGGGDDIIAGARAPAPTISRFAQPAGGPQFTRPGGIATPGFYNFNPDISDLQRRSLVATLGASGDDPRYRGQEARDYYKNILQRSFIDDAGKLSDISGLLPIEKQFLEQILGIESPGFADTGALLGQLSV
jgi:hypothetical protein|tara:strand:- start:2021 stop:3004 length:984 start_codon:yes stop_codon:yes gene_type:complete